MDCRYVVMEFDKNEVLIDALGGDLASPVWMFRAHLYAYSRFMWTLEQWF